MGINIGTQSLGKIYIGTGVISKVYIGTQLVFSSATPPEPTPIEQDYYDFYMADSIFNEKTVTYDNFRMMDSIKNKSKENVQ